ncbi:MAG TPA: hypothetical protein VNL34_04845 [Candidatus Nitrosotenuis sp.]|nr:hypothetical protein [Candidatus Nitrosotenuis sp.]
MTKVLLQLLIAAGVLSSATMLTTNAYAEICDINCEAPTIGVINNGQRIVDNGLIINGRAFTVEENIQAIPTMTFATGNMAKIKLEVYEDGGVDSIEHVSIAISDYQDDRNQNELASISLNQDFTGAQTVDVMDPNSILKSATAKATPIDEFRTMVEFSFKVVKPFDTSSLVVDMWDSNRASRSNVFLDAVRGTGNEIIDYVPAPPSTTPAPLKQVANGVAPQDVECREGFELVIRTNGAPACVYPFTAEILRSWGMVA